MEKEVIWELVGLGTALSKNIPRSVDAEDEEARETPKKLPEGCDFQPAIRIRIKKK